RRRGAGARTALPPIRAVLVLARLPVDRAPSDDAGERGLVPVGRTRDELGLVLLAWIADQPADGRIRVVGARDRQGQRGEAGLVARLEPAQDVAGLAGRICEDAGKQRLEVGTRGEHAIEPGAMHAGFR